MSDKKRTPYWWRVIEAAKVRKRAGKQAFTPGQIEKSFSWQDCACGKQDPRIPRFEAGGMEMHGMPVDDELSSLGATFHAQVSEGMPGKAATTLRQIERRAAEVLAALALAESGRG